MKTNISSISDIKSLNFVNYNQKKLFTKLEKYISSATKILLAVSGGADSLFTACLVYSFLLEKKYSLDNFFVIHCHHGVRKESDSEEKFVANFFSSLNENLFIKHYTGVNKKELDLRKWRYDVFGEVMNNVGAEYLVLGHHLNDRVESSFLHLLRGAGLQGFISMRESEKHYLLENKSVLRPLLGINKDYILDLCQKIGIPFIEDQSNFDSSVSKRNYLRNEILPELFKLSNKISKDGNTFLDSMNNVYLDIENGVGNNSFELQKYIDKGILKEKTVCKYWNAEWNYQLTFDANKLKKSLLVDILRGLGVAINITKKNIEEIVEFLCKNSNGYKYLNGVYFFVSHEQIYLIKAPVFFWKNVALDTKKVKVMDCRVVASRNDNNVGKSCFEFDSYELLIPKIFSSGIVRYPKVGDKYNGKTLNKWFINQKIPVFWRNFIPVLELEGKIVFVFINILL